MSNTTVKALGVALAFVVARGALAEEVPSPTGSNKNKKARPTSALEFQVKTIDGEPFQLQRLSGKVVLIVNVASECGLTEQQYAGLEKLYRKYKERGLEICAFPANNFGKQEPGTNAQIKAFCKKKEVTFRLFEKISVKGEDIHPLYRFLTSKDTGGKFAGDIKWNFQKFLLDRKGRVIARFDPPVAPLDKKVTAAVLAALET